jgi:oxygen-independent coproporphyrinogen III oxidase
MVLALVEELTLRKSYLKHEPLDTIYLGGGTPSLLDAADIEILFQSIYKNYTINSNPEITLEANPDDLKPGKLADLHHLGINRLSIGIQSFNDQTLKFLNRAHNTTEAIGCISNARTAGFDNLSIDLIFAIPGVTHEMLTNDIDIAMTLLPEHLSAYSLTIEEKTVFGNWRRKDKLSPVSDDASAEQFDMLISTLEKNGYEQYEISNFCRDRKYAVHNTSYWKNINYLGIGPGAHSYDGNSRQFNISNNPKYMKSVLNGVVPFEMEILDAKSKANEFLLTSLRTKWGCDLKLLEDYYGYDIKKNRPIEINKYSKNNLLITHNGIMYLTRQGRFIADEIISDLFWI